jgi:hypothetical protein
MDRDDIDLQRESFWDKGNVFNCVRGYRASAYIANNVKVNDIRCLCYDFLTLLRERPFNF